MGYGIIFLLLIHSEGVFGPHLLRVMGWPGIVSMDTKAEASKLLERFKNKGAGEEVCVCIFIWVLFFSMKSRILPERLDRHTRNDSRKYTRRGQQNDGSEG